MDDKQYEDYVERHLELLDYILDVIDNPEHNNSEIDNLDLNEDYNLKVPHVADMIYAVMKAKKLKKKNVLAFIVTGQGESGNLKYIDTELAASLSAIDELCETMVANGLDSEDLGTLRKIALSSFPGASKYTDIPVNPSLSKVLIFRLYLLALIEICLDENIHVEEPSSTNSEKNCFIATAVYGDNEHPKVELFRNFRDEKLKNYALGRAFIKFYYKYSPNFSKLVQKNYTLKKYCKSILDLIVLYLKKK